MCGFLKKFIKMLYCSVCVYPFAARVILHAVAYFSHLKVKLNLSLKLHSKHKLKPALKSHDHLVQNKAAVWGPLYRT